MTRDEEIKRLSPWVFSLPAEWEFSRLDNVADVIFSNVDKHTFDTEVSVKLCNYVDVYGNDLITLSRFYGGVSRAPRNREVSDQERRCLGDKRF